MDNLIKNRVNNIDYKALVIFLAIALLFNVLVLKIFAAHAIYMFVFELGILSSAIIFFAYKTKISVYLILVFFLQFLLLNNDFHYNFTLELLLSLPLFILFLIAWFEVLYKSKSFEAKLSKFPKLILLFLLYSFIMVIVGVIQGGDKFQIFTEWYHIFYYSYFFLFLFFFQETNDYHSILILLLVISVLISLEYIIINFYLLGERFVTFQANFIPIPIGILLSSFLFKQKKMLSLFLMFVLIIGMVSTQTRSLWIVSFIVIVSTLVFYLKVIDRLSYKKLAFLILICILPVLMVKDGGSANQSASYTSNKLESRAESLSDPTSDMSFLMRVEASYYAVTRFLESPVWGKGFGDHLRLTFTGDQKKNLYYIDNTWAYILWKGGAIGLILFLVIIFYFIKRLYYISVVTDEIKIKIIAVGLIGGVIGMGVLGAVSPHLVKYKSNILFPLLFAYAEFEYQKIINKGRMN